MVTREDSVSGPPNESTESSTATSKADKESTNVERDDRRVNRSPTIELPQNIPRVTPESEKNRTARMDESVRPPGTNTNVKMTLSLEDLQRLMETTINTAMDRRFGPENPAVRNLGIPKDPGPPIPPIPPVLGSGTGLVAPYQPGNTTTIRARDIGYFDPDPTKAPVEPKKTHQERYTVQDVRRRREPTEYMQLMVTAGRNAHQDANEAAICMLTYEHIDGILRQHVAKPNFQTTIQDFMASLRAARTLWFDIYTSYSNTGPGGGQNGRQASNTPQERRGLPPGRSNMSSNTPGYRDNTSYRQQGTWNHEQQRYGPNRPDIPQYNMHRNQDRPWQSQRPQGGFQQRDGQGNQGQGWNQGSSNMQRRIDGNNRPLAITSGDTRPGNNQRWPNSQQNGNGGYQNQQGQNRPWLNRSHNGTTRPQNGGTTNIPVKAYHGEPLDNDNPHDEYANEPMDESASYDNHQEYEAYEEDFYGSDAYHSNYYSNDPSTSGEGQQHGSTQDTRSTESTDVNFAPTGMVHECKNCKESFGSKNKLHRHLRTSCNRTIKKGPNGINFGAVDIQHIDTLVFKNQKPVDVLGGVVESNATDDAKGGYGFRGWQYVTAMVKLHATAKAEP
ncbi:MAG: hypothetical protein M1816_005007, partial [Peltula sp. TS41687]